jgi:hypothetical protein
MTSPQTGVRRHQRRQFEVTISGVCVMKNPIDASTGVERDETGSRSEGHRQQRLLLDVMSLRRTSGRAGRR